MAKTKIKFGDVLKIGNKKALYCGKLESRVGGHHRLLIFSRKKYKIQYVMDSFFKRLEQRGINVKIIGNNKEVAEQYRKSEEQRYDRIMF